MSFAERYCHADFPDAECQHKGEKSDQNQTQKQKGSDSCHQETVRSETDLSYLLWEEFKRQVELKTTCRNLLLL